MKITIVRPFAGYQRGDQLEGDEAERLAADPDLAAHIAVTDRRITFPPVGAAAEAAPAITFAKLDASSPSATSKE